MPLYAWAAVLDTVASRSTDGFLGRANFCNVAPTRAVVAAERSEAVALVLNAVPEGWAATLLPTRLTTRELVFLNMAPGEVRELKE